MDETARQQEAFNASTVMVTCLLHDDQAEARRIAFSNDVLYADMLMVLAGALAGCCFGDGGNCLAGTWSCCGGGTGRTARGSGAVCANTGAADTKAPNASSPDFKLHPPSAATSPSMPMTCLRVD